MRQLVRLGVCAVVAVAVVGVWVAGAGSKTLPRAVTTHRTARPHAVPSVRGTTCFVASGGSVCARKPCTVFVQSGVSQLVTVQARAPKAVVPQLASRAQSCSQPQQGLIQAVPARPRSPHALPTVPQALQTLPRLRSVP